MPYNGSIEVISGFVQKNNGDFPLMDASAVYVDDNNRLDKKLRDLEQGLEEFIPFTITVVDERPTIGEDMTFYLVKRPSGKYDKWWYITNESGNKVWDSFGGSSTAVVSSLPDDPDADTDYILATNGEYKYYKWYDDQWVLIAGSSSDVVKYPVGTRLKAIGINAPTTETYPPTEFEQRHYLKFDTMTLYVCQDGVWTEIGPIIANPSDSKDYYIINENNIWCHYRYIDGTFQQVGVAGYSKQEMDVIINALTTKTNSNGSKIGTLETNFQTLSNSFGILQQTVNGLDTEGYQYYATYEKEESSDNYVYKLHEKKGGQEEVVSSFVMQGGGGGGGQSATTLVVNRITPSPLIITPTDNAILQYTFSSEDSSGGKINGNFTWKLNGNVIASGACIEGTNTIDVTEYCVIGMQRFVLSVTDEGGNTAVRTFNVQKVDVRIESSFNDRYPVNPGESVQVPYIPYGAVSKTVHFELDGDEETITTSTSGVGQSYLVPAQSHGAHLLKMWITAVINSVDIITDAIYKDIIWYDPDNNTDAVIGCAYRYDFHGKATVRQYDTLAIPFTVFDSTTNFPIITRYVDGLPVGTETLQQNQSNWNYKSDTVGTHTLKITCRDTSVTIIVEVEELGIDVSPVTGGLELDFNPSGITNDSSDRIWHNSKYHMAVSSNFDWSNGGYKIDQNGDDYFLIKAGTYVTFDYRLFAGGVDGNPSVRGSEMKIIFMTENVQDISGVWLTNTETITTTIESGEHAGESQETNMGIQLGVHDGWLKTNKASSVDTEDNKASNSYLYMPYSDEDIIELDININPLDSNSSEINEFVMAYEDGVPSKAYVYDAADRFYQYTPQIFKIGSDVCDVRIYRFKIYSTSLDTNAIMRNFIADSRNSTTMLERYDRNCIYYNNETQEYSPYSSDGVIDPEKLAPQVPNVKILMLETDIFTANKKDFIKSNLRCIHAPGGKIYPGDEYYDNWYFENGWHSGQGTTSDNYGVSGRNVDFLFNCDGTHKPSDKVKNPEPDYISKLTLGYNTDSPHVETCDDWKGNDAKVSLTRTSIPNNFFNLKVNIASSENVNNALLQKRYNDFLPYISPAKARDSRVKNDMEFVPAILFLKETNPDVSAHREFKDNNWHFYALGNLGDSKKTDYTRAYDPNDMNEFTIEISDNTKNNATFQTGVYRKENGTLAYEPFYLLKTLDKEGELVVTPVSLVPSIQEYVYPVPEAQIDELLFEEGTIHVVNQTGLSEHDGDETGYLNMRIWGLYNEGFDGDHSFEPRYACCGDYRDGKLVNDYSGHGKAQVKTNEKVWRAFYKWVITASDEQFRAELDQWCVRTAVEFFYAFTSFYTMMDNRAKNTFWHFAKTGVFREVSRPVPELLHIYCEKQGEDNYVTTTDTEIDSSKTYYTQYAFDLWDYDNDTALGIKCQCQVKNFH